MKATVQIELEPFMTPNFVRAKSDKNGEATTFPLGSLDEYALDMLCREFYAEVFRKAGKTPPPKAA